MFPHRADEHAATVFLDVASSLDAGLPIDRIGGNPGRGNDVLFDLCRARGVTLDLTEKMAFEAAWRSGTAPRALRRRAAARERRAKFSRAVQSALAYPLLLLVMLLLASLATMAITGAGVVVGITVAYASGGAVIFVVRRKLQRGDSATERYPIIGAVVAELRELAYLEALHALYGAGVPVVDAHREALSTVRMRALRQQLTRAQAMLEEGHALAAALEATAALCQESRTMLANGELSGTLEEALERAVQRRTEVAERCMAAAARKLVAAVYAVAVAGVVAIVVLFYTNYYAPIFSMLR